MRLRKLQLYGFKSFADKTEFVFEPGLTAFVGPNGCGKSNVVDAVRWVLGEQRPRALRGSEMADVIFKGNGEGRGALGVAEATIIFSNQDRLLPIEYDEVAITRRLYRSGDSEYLINNQTCRLRDIRELLMDTGIGMDAYSIVEQGKIDLVLQSSPSERRAIFEEAAGISKYNAKRRAALNKLDRVEHNLLRLGDTIEEVAKRLRSIKRQASRARRYKQHSESLDRLRLAQALHEYHHLVTNRAATEQGIQDAEAQQDALAARLERLEAEKTAIDAENIEADQSLGRLETRLAELRAQRETLEEGIRLNRERLTDADNTEARIRQNLDALAQRVAAANQEIADTQQRAAQMDQELADLAQAIEDARTELQDANQRHGELGRQVEALRAEGLDCLREHAARQNELAGLESDCRALDAQRQRHIRRRQEIARRVADFEAQQQESAQATEAAEAEIEQARARFASRAEERGELRVQIESADEEIGIQRNALAARSSRRDLLMDLEARCEGVEAGTQHLMERSEASQRLHGMVAELVQVDAEHALAIEAALGDAVQHLVAETLDDAAEAVTHLKATNGGRSTLIPLDRLNGNGHNGNGHIEHPGVLGRATDLVRYDDRFAPAVKHLLGDTYVVSDLEAAVDIARSTDRDIRLATVSGDVLQPHGLVSGGSEHERTGLLSRKNELRTLNEEIEGIEQMLEQLRSQREHFISECSVLDTELEETRQRLDELNLRLATLREQASRLADRRAALLEEDEVIQAELEDAESDLAERRQRADALRSEVAALEERQESLKARLDEAERQRTTAEEERGAIERRLSDLGVRRAERASQREHLDSVVERLRSQLADAESEREHGEAELAQLDTRREAARREIAEKEQHIRQMLEDGEELGRQRVQVENRRAELMEQAESIGQEAQQTRAEVREQEQREQELRLQKNEQDLRVNALTERVRDDHRQDIAQLHQDYDEPDVDWDEVREEMAELKRKIDNMGSVNLLAIDEQEELEARHEFLTAQEEDLLRAKHALQEVIRKVNRRSRQLFEQTFTAVRENFQAIYRKLFGGGKADIILEADADILEAGVEVVAKPPGKEPSSIRLLSGGEKSLTAVALLLAIFKSKPSPFCVLDEVDAALDDANIGRFVGLVEEFLQDSQFILVTHSKQTMSVADALYGITMQEPGVSSHVSVKLDEIEEAQLN
jgi:chromosome segregation protein